MKTATSVDRGRSKWSYSAYVPGTLHCASTILILFNSFQHLYPPVQYYCPDRVAETISIINATQKMIFFTSVTAPLENFTQTKLISILEPFDEIFFFSSSHQHLFATNNASNTYIFIYIHHLCTAIGRYFFFKLIAYSAIF